MRKPILSIGAVLCLILAAPFFFSQCRKTDVRGERTPPDLMAGARAFVAKLQEQPPVYHSDNPRNDRTMRTRVLLWPAASITRYRGQPAVMVPLHSAGFFADGSVYFLAMLSHFLFLILAGLFLALRFANCVYRQQFIYIFIATLNLCLGLHSVAVYLLSYVIIGYPEMMSANFSVGVLLLIDALFLKRKPYELTLKNS